MPFFLNPLSIPFPPAASLALSFGLWLREYGALLGGFLFLLFASSLLFFCTKEGRKTAHSLLYRSRFYRRILLVRFSAALSALLESGHPLTESLRDARDVVGNEKAKEPSLSQPAIWREARILPRCWRKAASPCPW